MCPFCVASIGVVVAGIVSTGGLAALAVKVSAKRNKDADSPNSNERSKDDGNEQD